MADGANESGNLIRRSLGREIIPRHIGPLGITSTCTGAWGAMS
jgi:hypothetical protein